MKQFLLLIAAGFTLALGACDESDNIAADQQGGEPAISAQSQAQPDNEYREFRRVEASDVAPSQLEYEEELTVLKSDGGTVDFDLLLAITSEEKARGMMYRNFMPDDKAMLFIFDAPYVAGFWMKNVYIPLDMLFISEDGTIHHIHHMAEPMNEASIRAEQPSRAVLEIRGGLAEELNIQEGDILRHSAFDQLSNNEEEAGAETSSENSAE